MPVMNRSCSHYRHQARHLHKMADETADPELKEQLLILAKDYAGLALRAQRMAMFSSKTITGEPK